MKPAIEQTPELSTLLECQGLQLQQSRLRDGGGVVGGDVEMATTEPLQQPYKYSMKVETRTKGKLAPSVHVYGDDAGTVRRELVQQYLGLVEDFKAVGVSVVGATDTGE
jgi:hypothetical protein